MTLLSPSRADDAPGTVQAARGLQGHDVGALAGASRLVALLGLGLLVSGVALPNPVVVLIGLIVSTTAWQRRWLSWDLAVPAAALSLLSAAVIAGLLAGFLGLNLLAFPSLLAAVYVGYGGTVAALVGRSPRVVGSGACIPWWTMGPAAIAAATGLVQAFSVGVAKSWAFWGTDIAKHMTLTESIQRQGSIDYSVTPYPQGAHMLASLLSVPGAPLEEPARLMSYDLRLVTAITWLALALMLWTGAALVVHVGRRLHLAPAIPPIAALLLGVSALLTNTFLAGFVQMGAYPSLLAVVALWTLPLAIASRSPRPEHLPVLTLGACAQTMLLAHLWQSLAIVPAIAWAIVTVSMLRQLPPLARSRTAWVAAGRCLPGLVLCVAVAAVPLFSVQRTGGLALAATPGNFPGEPWALLVPAVMCLPMTMWSFGNVWARYVLGTTVGLTAVWALMLRGAEGDLHAWYPLKAAWFLTLALCPLLALAAVSALARIGGRVHVLLGRTGRPAFVLRATTYSLAVAAAFGFWLPHILGSGSLTLESWRPLLGSQGPGPAGQTENNWSTTRYDLAARYGPRFAPAVVVPYHVGARDPFDGLGNQIVSELLAFQTGQPEMLGEPADVCAAVESVAGRDPAVILSTLPAQEIRRNMSTNGCGDRAAVIRVPRAER
jgi:hypothetical protein